MNHRTVTLHEQLLSVEPWWDDRLRPCIQIPSMFTVILALWESASELATSESAPNILRNLNFLFLQKSIRLCESGFRIATTERCLSSPVVYNRIVSKKEGWAAEALDEASNNSASGREKLPGYA